MILVFKVKVVPNHSFKVGNEGVKNSLNRVFILRFFKTLITCIWDRNLCVQWLGLFCAKLTNVVKMFQRLFSNVNKVCKYFIF